MAGLDWNTGRVAEASARDGDCCLRGFRRDPAERGTDAGASGRASLVAYRTSSRCQRAGVSSPKSSPPGAGHGTASRGLPALTRVLYSHFGGRRRDAASSVSRRWRNSRCPAHPRAPAWAARTGSGAWELGAIGRGCTGSGRHAPPISISPTRSQLGGPSGAADVIQPPWNDAALYPRSHRETGNPAIGLFRPGFAQAAR